MPETASLRDGSLRQRNPYDKVEEPALHTAWKEGWGAYHRGVSLGRAPIPERYKRGPSMERSAWLDGYAAAQAENSWSFLGSRERG